MVPMEPGSDGRSQGPILDATHLLPGGLGFVEGPCSDRAMHSVSEFESLVVNTIIQATGRVPFSMVVDGVLEIGGGPIAREFDLRGSDLSRENAIGIARDFIDGIPPEHR